MIESVNWTLVWWYTLLAAGGIQAIYYLFIYSRVGFHKEPTAVRGTDPVSVIVCARNEIDNLKKNLPLILEQDYPTFELIVVNDSSFDGTKDYLDDLAKKDQRLKPVHLDIDERYQKGKKFALTIGIKAAEHERMLLTDADCKPMSNNWINEMSAGFDKKDEIVLGLSFFRLNYRPVNFFSRIESFHTAMQYINFALAKIPYMGVGRNLAYSQQLFFKHKGFASHQHLISGDDDLFVNETATKTNVNIRISKDSQTESEAMKSLGKWWKQKTRHFSSSKKYKFRHKFLLFWPAFSLLFFWAAALALILTNTLLIPTLIVIGSRLLIQWVVIGLNLHKFGKIANIWTVPFWDPVMLFIQIFMGLRGSVSKPKTWK